MIFYEQKPVSEVSETELCEKKSDLFSSNCSNITVNFTYLWQKHLRKKWWETVKAANSLEEINCRTIKICENYENILSCVQHSRMVTRNVFIGILTYISYILLKLFQPATYKSFFNVFYIYFLPSHQCYYLLFIHHYICIFLFFSISVWWVESTIQQVDGTNLKCSLHIVLSWVLYTSIDRPSRPWALSSGLMLYISCSLPRSSGHTFLFFYLSIYLFILLSCLHPVYYFTYNLLHEGWNCSSLIFNYPIALAHSFQTIPKLEFSSSWHIWKSANRFIKINKKVWK